MSGERDQRPSDEGMTLIEVLVAMGLFAVVGSLLLSLALSTSAVTDTVKANTGVDEEARTAMERMTRELRQATQIQAVHLASHTDPTIWIRFWTDFDGNHVESTDASNPEVMTYTWTPPSAGADGTLSLSALGSDSEKPLLAADVTHFALGLESSDWEYDSVNGTDSEAVAGERRDSVTWSELDKSALGNLNGRPDGAELDHINLVTVAITVDDGSGSESYGTQIDLRNGGAA